MPLFRYRLETLLSLRRSERDARRQKYAEALTAQEMLNQQLDAVAAEIADVRTLTRQRTTPSELDVDRLLRAHRYELLLQTRLRQLEQQVARVAEEAERRRQVLLQADREVRVLEKHREHQSDRHRQRELQREQKQLDDIAQRPYVQRAELP